MLLNEAELAQRASEHDQSAFAELYNVYVDKIYKYIYYKVGDASDAEDLCEQVFLKAWEAIGRYTADSGRFSLNLNGSPRSQNMDDIKQQADRFIRKMGLAGIASVILI